MTTEAEIEAWLLIQDGWVSAAELCARFGIARERELRCLGEVPGLVSEFAISHTRKGYRHVRHATREEWLRFKHSQRGHAVAEFRRVRQMEKKRRDVCLPTLPPMEKDTGQYQLL